MQNQATEQMLGKERRSRRSADPVLAIGFQLKQVIEDFSLDCCIIADDQGVIEAMAPESPTVFMEKLSQVMPTMALAPEIGPAHLSILRSIRPDLRADQLSVCVFRAGGQRMFIAAVGDEAVMNEVAIMRAITGARRILID